MGRESTSLAASLILGATVIAAAAMAGSGSRPSDSNDLFERKIRPLFLEKCVSCHGSPGTPGGPPRAGLSLTSRAALLKGGKSGAALVPGQPRQSLLLAAVRREGRLKMPPAGPLSVTEVRSLEDWVSAGAPWPEGPAPPAGSGTFRVSETQRRWWSFQPVRPMPAEVLNDDRELDRMVRSAQKRRGISAAAPADRRTLIRRITFDLTGLPPTPGEVQQFVDDNRPQAYQELVDRLLASPAYGERMARHWLDIVRYADYHDGNPKARTASCEPLNAWRYRDWVVSALNRDLPYDQFLTHQIAGDLLPPPSGSEYYADGLVATTFLTNGSWDRGDADKEKMVSDMVDDQIDTIGKAFLGVTLGCARCHDHKFDPISQRDYYALAGIFYSTHILADIGAKGGEYTVSRIPMAPRELVEKRTRQLALIAELTTRKKELEKSPVAAQDPERASVAMRLAAVERELLPEPPLAEAAVEGGQPKGLFPGIQDVPIHIRGSYTRLGEVVPRGVPAFLSRGEAPPVRTGSGRRELAAWITSPRNPLTARVIANRVWQWHFGSGLVRTPNNFGLLSEPPTHPDLLDWLAAGLVRDGWSLKKLHRRIVLSETYRQSGSAAPDQVERDPENRWLGRYASRRLEAEAIRDAILSVAGSLDRAPGGPATDDLSLPRRSLYVQTARWDRSSFATLFDAANPDASEERRGVSTVAPQALFLLNHSFTRRLSGMLAKRLLDEHPESPGRRLEAAYELAYARRPTPTERRLALEFVQRDPIESAAWRRLCHVLLCSNEFIYLD